MSIRLPSYPKIYNLGNKAIEPLFQGEVEITEKIDGSQFKFGIMPDGQVTLGSKNQEIHSADQNGMFCEAYEQVQRATPILQEVLKTDEKARNWGLWFYGEYLQKPKHNTIVYNNIPKNHIALFGARYGEGWVETYEEVQEWANKLGFDTVPLIYRGLWEDFKGLQQEKEPEKTPTALDLLKSLIGETTSYLEGSLIEGVVIKNYSQQTLMQPYSPCFGKFVSEKFKERNDKEWKKNSAKHGLQDFMQTFKAEARWQKAVQHLKEKGELTESPKDIGALMKEIQIDIEAEEKEHIKDHLYKMYIKDIKRIACAGVAEWYKEKLLEQQPM